MKFFSHLFLDSYGVNIYICPYRRFDELFKFVCPDNDWTLDKTTAGHCCRIGRDKIFVLFNEEEISPSIISHECLHATTFLYRDILECKHNENTEEVYAYFLGWLVRKVYETIAGDLERKPEDLYIIDETSGELQQEKEGSETHS